MILERLMDNAGKINGRGVIRDKDTLAMALPPVLDLSLYTTLFDSVNETTQDNIRYLLLDFTKAEKLCDSGIAAFICLQKLARDMHIRLLMVDTPAIMHNRLEMAVPDAFWIDMSQKDIGDGNELVQEMIAKRH